jgi:hypothetical protein
MYRATEQRLVNHALKSSSRDRHYHVNDEINLRHNLGLCELHRENGIKDRGRQVDLRMMVGRRQRSSKLIAEIGVDACELGQCRTVSPCKTSNLKANLQKRYIKYVHNTYECGRPGHDKKAYIADARLP